jgi:hypothetical protein
MIVDPSTLYSKATLRRTQTESSGIGSLQTSRHVPSWASANLKKVQVEKKTAEHSAENDLPVWAQVTGIRNDDLPEWASPSLRELVTNQVKKAVNFTEMESTHHHDASKFIANNQAGEHWYPFLVHFVWMDGCPVLDVQIWEASSPGLWKVEEAKSVLDFLPKSRNVDFTPIPPEVNSCHKLIGNVLKKRKRAMRCAKG